MTPMPSRAAVGRPRQDERLGRRDDRAERADARTGPAESAVGVSCAGDRAVVARLDALVAALRERVADVVRDGDTRRRSRRCRRGRPSPGRRGERRVDGEGQRERAGDRQRRAGRCARCAWDLVSASGAALTRHVAVGRDVAADQGRDGRVGRDGDRDGRGDGVRRRPCRRRRSRRSGRSVCGCWSATRSAAARTLSVALARMSAVDTAMVC